MKRNIASEIKGLKERNAFGAFSHSLERISGLKRLLPYIQHLPDWELKEFCKYIPIACVASLESFMRSSIQELIDKEEKYFENSTSLFQRTIQKIDFDIVSHLQKKSFTIGELISHLLPCNNIGDFNNSLSEVLGEDFLNIISRHGLILSPDDSYEKIPTEDFEKIKKSLNRMFQLRHIFAHESSGYELVNKEEIFILLDHFDLFFDFASDFVNSKLYRHWGLYPMERMEVIGKEWEQMESELDQKLNSIKENRINHLDYPEEAVQHFDQMIEHWKQFAKEKAQFKSSLIINNTWATIEYYEDKMKSIEYLLSDVSRQE
jgi:hypothetical protein